MRNVLIVDDDATFSDLISDFSLETWPGCKVEIAINAQDAQKLLKSMTFDFIMLDWRLPKISGLALFNRLRTLPEYLHSPVLVCSGLLKEADFRLLEEYPCTASLAKPFPLEIFRETIVHLVQEWHWYTANIGKVRDIIERISAQRKEAFAELQKLLKSSPNPTPVTITAARALRDKGDLAVVEALLGALIKRDPGCVIGLFELGKTLFQSGRLPEALKVLTYAQKLSPKNLSRVKLMGEIELNQGNIAEAKAHFEQALTIDPDDSRSKKGLELAGEMAEVSQPNMLRSLASMVNMTAIGLVRQGRFEEGIKQYRDALEFIADSGDKARVSFNCGLAFERWGQPAQARPWFEEADKVANGTFEKARRRLSLQPQDLGSGDFITIDSAEPVPDAPHPKMPQPPATLAPKPVQTSPAAPAPSPQLAEKISSSAQDSDSQIIEIEAKAPPPLPAELEIPENSMSMTDALALATRMVQERLTAIEALQKAKGSKRYRVLLYHPETGGCQRAARQLHSLEFAPSVETYAPADLTEELRQQPYALMLAWCQNGGSDSVLKALEEALEEPLSYTAYLLHVSGDKDLISYISNSRLLPGGFGAKVNWNRARFEADVLEAIASQAPDRAYMKKLASILDEARLGGGVPERAAKCDAQIEALKSEKKEEWAAYHCALTQVSVLNLTGRGEQALQAAEGLATRWPDSFPLRLKAAEAAARHGKPEALGALVNWLNSADKLTTGRLFHLGQAMLVSEDVGSIMEVLKEWGKTPGPQRDHHYFMLTAQYLAKLGNIDEALRCLATALEKKPLRGDFLYFAAELLFAQRNYSQAATFADLSAKCQLSSPLAAHGLKVRSLLGEDRKKDAETAFTDFAKIVSLPQPMAGKLRMDWGIAS